MSKREYTQEVRDSMVAIFHEYDCDGNGVLSLKEVQALFREFPTGLGPQEMEALWKAADVDRNGTLSIEEFIDFIFDVGDEVASTPFANPPNAVWIQKTLTAHNNLRAIHGAPPLEWCFECFDFAKKAAEHCSKKAAGGGPILEHTHCDTHGQNGFWSGGPGKPPEHSVKDWYSEIQMWDFANGEAVPGECGHFTQVVWAGTKKVGLAQSGCGCYVFANYSPPGNDEDWKKNVLPIIPAEKQKFDEREAAERHE